MTTPAGMVLDGTFDRIEAPAVARPARGEVATSLIDFLEF